MRSLYLVLIAGLTFACGKIDKQEITSVPLPGSGNTQATNASAAFLVEAAAQLPPCTPAIEGQLVYVRSEAVFASCSSSKWTKVNMSSAASGIQTALYCTMTASKADLLAAGLDSVPDSGINFYYTITQFANGTRYIQSRISSGQFSYSSGIFWADKQVGYGTALSDNIAFDVHGAADFGFFYFTADATITGDDKNPYAIVYSDPAIPEGKALIFDSKKDCSVNVY